MTIENTARMVKGVNIIDLVKVLKIYKRKRPLMGLSSATEALMEERVLPNRWYPHECFLEMMDIVFRELLGSNEQAAVQMGLNGGHTILTTVHRVFVCEGDPVGSVLAMRHVWPAYFNFGAISGEPSGERSVLFTITDYPDVSLVHALMMIGWAIAAAQLGGARNASYEVFERPWKGEPQLRYIIEIEN